MDLEGPPASHGFYMPAEWEPHSQCWMGWPVSTYIFIFPSLHDIIMLFRLMGHENLLTFS